MEHNRIGSEAQDSIHVSSKIHAFLYCWSVIMYCG